MARMIREDVEAISRIWFRDFENNESKQELLLKYPSVLKVCDERDQRIDFHALRHSCGAWLALSGVHAKTIQSIMRHKDVKLTLEAYGHLFQSMEREALDKLGQLTA